MWIRRELKEKAKERIRGNYWKSMLAALILMAVAGGISGGSAVSRIMSNHSGSERDYKEQGVYRGALEETYGNDSEEVYGWGEIEGKAGRFMDHIMVAAIMGVIVAAIILAVLVILVPLKILVFHPLEVGCSRFFFKNGDGSAQVKEICYAFDNGYKNGVKTMFFRWLYTFFWSLLLIIPGIIKSYEYQMMPYILAEHPDMEMKEVFARSRSMMMGNKWNAFVLDLSFLGWYILNVFTLGILGIFYISPYKAQTDAELYRTLKEFTGR